MAGCFELRGGLHDDLVGNRDKLPAELSPPTPPQQKPSPPAFASPQFAVVVHAVPTRYRLGDSRRWLEEDNRYLHVSGARWLL